MPGTRNRLTAIALLLIGVAVLGSWVVVQAARDRPCGDPAATDAAGNLDLGPVAATALEPGATARLFLAEDQARFVVVRLNGTDHPVTLRMTSCDGAVEARLVAIGADRSISVPSTFPQSAGADVAVLPGEHTRFVVVVLAAHPGQWRLSVNDGKRRLGSTVVELVRSAH